MKTKTYQTGFAALVGLGLLAGSALVGAAPVLAQDDGQSINRSYVPPHLRQWAPPDPGVNVPAPRYYHHRYYDRGHYYDPRYVSPAPRYHHRKRHARSLAARHIDWCYGQYRSYREWDNSWKPLRGPRRQCISPWS